jgi:fucose permease
MTSEKSAVNPFSIANVNSEAQSEEMVTAEGFFKNPTATAKKIETV